MGHGSLKHRQAFASCTHILLQMLSGISCDQNISIERSLQCLGLLSTGAKENQFVTGAWATMKQRWHNYLKSCLLCERWNIHHVASIRLWKNNLSPEQKSGPCPSEYQGGRPWVWFSLGTHNFIFLPHARHLTTKLKICVCGGKGGQGTGSSEPPTSHTFYSQFPPPSIVFPSSFFSF